MKLFNLIFGKLAIVALLAAAFVTLQGCEEDDDTLSETESILEVSVEATEYEEGVGYVDLGLSVKWAITNVGGDNPYDKGDHYFWGDTITYCSHANLEESGYNDTVYTDIVSHVMGGNWKTPTKDQLQELLDSCTFTYAQYEGSDNLGFLVTGPNGNSIFLPLPGYYIFNNNLRYDNCAAYYMSSDTVSDGKFYSLYIFKKSYYEISENTIKYHGYSVRGVIE